MTIEIVIRDGALAPISAASREVLRRYHDAFRHHAPAALVDLVAQDCVIENIAPAPDGSRHVGKQACLAVWQPLAEARDKHFEHEEIFVVGDRVITRWRLRWGAGEQDCLRGLNMMRVRDGQIVEALGYAKR